MRNKDGLKVTRKRPSRGEVKETIKQAYKEHVLYVEEQRGHYLSYIKYARRCG